MHKKREKLQEHWHALIQLIKTPRDTSDEKIIGMFNLMRGEVTFTEIKKPLGPRTLRSEN